jgi:hypothetical protein
LSSKVAACRIDKQTDLHHLLTPGPGIDLQIIKEKNKRAVTFLRYEFTLQKEGWYERKHCFAGKYG